jgi:hypothetical protein
MEILCHFRIDLDIAASNAGRAGSRAVSEDLVILFNIDDGGTADTDGTGSGLGGGTGERDRAEVSELNHGATLLEVLDNPLSVVLAQVAYGALVAERVLDGLASGVVLDGCSACGLAGGGDSHSDGVSSGEGDSREVIGVIGVPLIPSIISDGRAWDTHLEIYISVVKSCDIKKCLPDLVQSMPVWRMAVAQVSPSMPTQAEPEPAVDGVGTVKVPVTLV